MKSWSRGWDDHIRIASTAKLWHWLGTPEDWRKLQGWYYGEPPCIKSTNEHIGRKELQVYNLATEFWEIAHVGDYVVQEILPSDRFRGGQGWHYRVITEEQFKAEGWEKSEPRVYKPPGVYA